MKKAANLMAEQCDIPPQHIIQTPGKYQEAFPHTKSSWIYARYRGQSGEQIWIAYNMQDGISFSFPRMPKILVQSAATVLNDVVYVIGGKYNVDIPCRDVYQCDLQGFKWVQAPTMIQERHNHMACGAQSKIYVFAGEGKNFRSGEVFDPSNPIKGWSKWPKEEQLVKYEFVKDKYAQDKHVQVEPNLHPPFWKPPIVLGSKIIVSDLNATASLDVKTGKWKTEATGTSRQWHASTNAALVQGLLVTYKIDFLQGRLTVTMVAYDYELETCIPVYGLPEDPDFVGSCIFLASNDNLVIYHKETANSASFTVYGVEKRLPTSLSFNFLRKFCYPIPGGAMDDPLLLN